MNMIRKISLLLLMPLTAFGFLCEPDFWDNLEYDNYKEETYQGVVAIAYLSPKFNSFVDGLGNTCVHDVEKTQFTAMCIDEEKTVYCHYSGLTLEEFVDGIEKQKRGSPLDDLDYGDDEFSLILEKEETEEVEVEDREEDRITMYSTSDKITVETFVKASI